eukprot:m.60248 g.60248  ORF g.60248 m.60248 type:complete len:102 (+) comp7933_c0_seq7:287-592(+)
MCLLMTQNSTHIPYTRPAVNVANTAVDTIDGRKSSLSCDVEVQEKKGGGRRLAENYSVPITNICMYDASYQCHANVHNKILEVHGSLQLQQLLWVFYTRWP